MKNQHRIKFVGYFSSLVLASIVSGVSHAGPRGSEFDLTLTPAAGGMEGVGTARPQDPIAMLFGNPSTLTQIEGKNEFTIGATFAAPKLLADGTPTDLFGGPAGPAPLTGFFDGQSRITELVAPHAAAIHRITPKLVVGMGITGISGLGSDFRDVAGLPNIIADLKLFGGNMTAAYQLTDNFSIGGTITIGIGNLQAGLTESGGAVNNLGYGGSVGFTYDAGAAVLGIAYKFELDVEYENVIEVAPDVFNNLTLQQPQEIQVGIATGKSLLPNSVVEFGFRYKNWDNAEGYNSFWKDQYIFSLGGQHKLPTRIGNVFLRAGYTYNTAIAKNESDLGFSFGSITFVKNPGFADPNQPPSLPVTPTFLQLAQATIADGHWQQSVSIGLGYEFPNTNVRLDLNTSYAFDGEATFGRFNAKGSLFTAGMGFTWKF